jgi:hypothetical protein
VFLLHCLKLAKLLTIVASFCVVRVSLINLYVLVIHRFLCLVFSIFYFHHRTMLLVCDSLCGCRLGCADFASGSWSDLAKVIGHIHCEIVFRDFGRDHMMSMIFVVVITDVASILMVARTVGILLSIFFLFIHLMSFI